LLLVALLAAACASDGSQAETVFGQMVDAVEDVQSARAEIRVTIQAATGSGEESVSLRGTADYEQPDRARLIASVAAGPAALGQVGEIGIIAIGSDMYVKPPMSGEWLRMNLSGLPFDMGLSPDVNPLKAMSDLRPGDLGDLTLLPQETIDGVLTDHLRFTTDEQGILGLLDAVAASGGLPSGGDAGIPQGLEVDLQFDVWIGVDDHLPRKETFMGSFAGTGDSSGIEESVSLDGVITFSRYGEDLGIQPPENVAPWSTEAR